MSANSDTSGGQKRPQRSRGANVNDKNDSGKSNESKGKSTRHTGNKKANKSNAGKKDSKPASKPAGKPGKKSASKRRRRNKNKNQDLEGSKLVVRLLPPNLTEEQFYTTIKDHLHDDNFIKTFGIVQSYYVSGHYPVKLFNEPTCARGYLIFNDINNLKKFAMLIKDVTFVDDRDNATKPTLRMSPYSKILNKNEITPGKKNLSNTLANDRIFKIFLNSLNLLQSDDEANYTFNGKISLLKPLEKELNKQKELETIIKKKKEIALVQLAGAPAKDKKKKKKKKKKNEKKQMEPGEASNKIDKTESTTTAKKKKKSKKKSSSSKKLADKNKIVIPNNNVVILEAAGKKELQKRKKLQQKKESEKPTKLKYNISAASFIPDTPPKYNTSSEPFQFKTSSNDDNRSNNSSSNKNFKYIGD